MRPQRTRASRTLGKAGQGVPWLCADPEGMQLQNWEVQNGSRMPPCDIAWILTTIAVPLSSAQVPLTHGAPWEDHAEKEVQSIDTYDGKQVVPQLGKSGTTQPKHRQSALCTSLTAMVHLDCLPSRLYKKGTHQDNSKHLIKSKVVLLRSSFHFGDRNIGVSRVMGVPPIAGWFLLGKIPLKYGWLGGTPILGNHHVCLYGSTASGNQGAGWMIRPSWPRSWLRPRLAFECSSKLLPLVSLK